MTTGNYLVDIGFQKEEKTSQPDLSRGITPYLQDVQNAVEPTANLPQRAEQEIDLASFGLQNMEEYDLMTDVKTQGGTGADFREILEIERQKKDNTFNQSLGKVEEDLPGLDIGVKTGDIISETAKKFKFQSNVDDGVIESGAKFLANIPGNTAQIAGDLISVASDPIGTAKSLLDLGQGISDKIIFGTLNTVFGQDIQPTEQALMVDSILGELKKIATTPGGIKELLVENPADVLLSVMGGLGVAKNVAKTKGLTGLVSKLEKAEKLTNPLRIQAEALKGTAKVIGKGTTKLTEKLIDTTLKLTPSETSKIRKATVGGKQTPSQWLLKNGIIDDTKALKGQEGIATKLQEFGGESYNKLNKSVSKAKGTFVNENVNKGINAIVKEIDDIPGLETKIARAKELQLKSVKGLTLSEQLEVKRLIDSTIDLYKVTGDPRAGSVKEGLINIRRGIREAIESEALLQGLGDVKQLSNDIRVSRLIKDGVLSRIDASPKSAISFTDIVVGGGAFAGSDAGTAIAIIAGKKIIESPAFKLFATKTLRMPGQVLNKIKTGTKLSGKESLIVGSAVQEFISKEGGKLKEIIGGKFDELADKTGARAKFIDDTGKSLDDFSLTLQNKDVILTGLEKVGKKVNTIEQFRTELQAGLHTDLIEKVNKLKNITEKNQVLKFIKEAEKEGDFLNK